MMATVGTDKLCKVWDIHNQVDGKYVPKCVGSRDLKQGDLFSVQFYEDIPWVLAAGGSQGQVAIWDTEESENVAKHFGGNLDKDAPK